MMLAEMSCFPFLNLSTAKGTPAVTWPELDGTVTRDLETVSIADCKYESKLPVSGLLGCCTRLHMVTRKHIIYTVV